MRDELRRTLRGAVSRGDSTAVIAALDGVDVTAYLQVAGDGVATAVIQGTDGAGEAADRFVTTLNDRSWDGDAELATALEAALGLAAPSGLGELPVRLDALAELLEGEGDDGAINLDDGQVWKLPSLEFRETGELDDLDNGAWLHVDHVGSRPAYRDMEAFITTITDSHTADRLWMAIDGTRAFGRFRRVLERDDELHNRWHAFSEERRLGRARAWLARAGYRPTARDPIGTPERPGGPRSD